MADLPAPTQSPDDTFEPRESSEGASFEGASILPFPKMKRPTDPAAQSADLRAVVGSVLRDERHRQGRTLADVAAESAVSLAYLSEIERGRKDVSSDLLNAVCDALELPLVDLFERGAERLRVRAERGIQFRLCAA